MEPSNSSNSEEDKELTSVVIRDHYSSLCTVLSTSKETLDSLVVKLYSERLISMQTKTSVMQEGGQKGANSLLDHIVLKMQLNPANILRIIEVMNSIELVSDVVQQMGVLKVNGDWKQETLNDGNPINL